MRTLRFHWLRAQAFVHATEDEEKVAFALERIAGRPPQARTTTKGHFGNPIIILGTDISNRAGTAAFFKGLGENVIADIRRELPERVDEDGVLSLRFSKQDACKGKVVLVRGGGDVIHVQGKVRRYPGDLHDARGDLEKFLDSLARPGP